MENISNLCKTRRWDIYSQINSCTNYYITYHLKKKDLGKYLNTWFIGIVSKSPSKTGNKTYRDERITLKKVDKETARHLYHEKFNPVSVTIMCPTGAKFKQDENGNDLYIMAASIHSIDDSSFGIWWDDRYGKGYPLQELKEIRLKIMQWINSKPIINGEEFLNYCITLGALEETKDYN